jgi:hypothetical protein
MSSEQFFKLDRRSAFPLVHKNAQQLGFLKMDNGMHMIRHNHKPGTGAGLIEQLCCKIMDDNLFGSIMIKNFSASIAGKCHEKGMVFIIKYCTTH